MIKKRTTFAELWWRWGIVVLFAIFLQASLVRMLGGISLVVPSLLAILVVYLVLAHLNLIGVFLAFLTGLMFDVSSGVLVGPWAASAMALFLALSYVSPHIFPESIIAIIILSALGSLLTTGIFLSLSNLFPVGDPNIHALLGTLAVEALVTALFAPLIFFVVYRVVGR